MRYLKQGLSILLLCVFSHSYAQDTTAALTAFNKVMSFTIQPYVHYTSITKTAATPLLQPEDTMTISGEFYKNGNNLYMGSGKTDIFLEDSFYIEVNHDRKSIWISRVNTETKKRMNLMPLDNRDMRDLFRKNYTISQTSVNKTSEMLRFYSKQDYDSITSVISNIAMQYTANNYLPEMLEMDVQMKQQISPESLQQVKEQGLNTNDLIQNIDGVNYAVRHQKVTMTFSSIETGKEKSTSIPSWKDRISYNTVTNEFSAKQGYYTDYEIIKTY